MFALPIVAFNPHCPVPWHQYHEKEGDTEQSELDHRQDHLRQPCQHAIDHVAGELTHAAVVMGGTAGDILPCEKDHRDNEQRNHVESMEGIAGVPNRRKEVRLALSLITITPEESEAGAWQEDEPSEARRGIPCPGDPPGLRRSGDGGPTSRPKPNGSSAYRNTRSKNQ